MHALFGTLRNRFRLTMVMAAIITMIAALFVSPSAEAEPVMAAPVMPTTTASFTVPAMVLEADAASSLATMNEVVLPAPAPEPAPVTYTVVAGDSLSKIARSFDLASFKPIWDVNPQLTDQNVINPGDVLTIPTGPTTDRPLVIAAAPQAPAVERSTTNASPVPVATEAAPTVSASGSAVVDFARSKLGIRYVWGGTTDSGYDCSGLMMKAYASVGISLPRNSKAQSSAGTRISRSDIQPGDLIYWNKHIAMYSGNGQMIEAPNSRSVVREVPVRWDGVLAITRVS